MVWPLASRTAIFTAVVLLLLQSVFWASEVPIAMKAVFIGVAVLSFFRPLNGLLVLAALAPLAGAWSPLLVGRVRGAETLVLAFLAGALVRGWTLHQFRRVPHDPLHAAAGLFGAIVAASCVHQLWLSGGGAREVFSRLAGHYLSSFRGLGMVFNAMLLLEGLALLLYVVHYCSHPPAVSIAPSSHADVRCAGGGGVELRLFCERADGHRRTRSKACRAIRESALERATSVTSMQRDRSSP